MFVVVIFLCRTQGNREQRRRQAFRERPVAPVVPDVYIYKRVWTCPVWFPETGQRCVPRGPRVGWLEARAGLGAGRKAGTSRKARFPRTSSSALVCSCHRNARERLLERRPIPKPDVISHFFPGRTSSASSQIKCRWSKDPGLSSASSVSNEE